MTDWQPQKGEVIEVSNSQNTENWLKREFLVYNEKSDCPWVVLGENKPTICPYPYARPIQKEEDEIKLWDVVELEERQYIVINKTSVFYEFYDPFRCRSLQTGFGHGFIPLKKLPNKVAMAPASWVADDDVLGSGRIISQPTTKDSSDYCWSKGSGGYRWPHTIASLSIEDKI